MEVTLKPTQKQHLAYQALKDPEVDTVFLGGGAGGGKTWLICESRLINAYLYPGYKSFIGREELKRLMQSTYVTWTKVCSFHNIPKDDWKLNGQYNYIEFKNGSRIDLLDLKYLPTDPLYERFGSLEYTDGAIEEAGEVEFLAYDVLKSRVGRHMNEIVHPSILITGNPKKNWTYSKFYKPWKAGNLEKSKVFIQSLYNDNPFTAESYGKQLAGMSDKANKERLMFGNWEYDDDPSTLIEYDAILDLFTNTVDSGDNYITADIARYGSDKIVIYLWNGLSVKKIYKHDSQGIDTTSEEIRTIASEEKVPFSRIIVDDDGVGGGVTDTLRGIKGFVNNSAALPNPVTHQQENYQNLKTQCYYKLAEYINNHKIAIETKNEKFKEDLIEELEQVKSKDSDKDAKKRLLPKEEVKEIIGRSPDYSDALMMRMYFELKPTGLKAGSFMPQNTDRSAIPQIKLAKQWRPN